MEEIKLCSYGCGQIAIKQFKNGKYCCNKTYKSCPTVTDKTTKKIRGYKPDSKLFENKLGIICDYGCGKEAEYIIEFKHYKKFCCSKNYSSCKSNIKTWNKGLTNETDERVKKLSQIKNKKYSKINYYLKNWKNILEIEFLDEDPESKELIVRCKECGEKFKPKKREIENRFCNIKKGELNKGCFYCYHCKEKRKYKNPDYIIYYGLVLKETERSIRKNKTKIKVAKLDQEN
jgi:hypothetical protein